MLPGATVGLLFGVWLFQQQAQLWSWMVWGMWLSVLLVLAGIRVYVSTRRPEATRLQRFFHQCLLIVLMAALGFAYAQSRAWWRLQSVFPAMCEQQVLSVQGVIVSVPERDAQGQHMDVAIENSAHPACRLPDRIRLHVYAQSYPHAAKSNTTDAGRSAERTAGRGRTTPDVSARAQARLPSLQAGERWQFTVRLKRPHATRNPHGFDYAAWCLANQIGASGSVVTKAPMHRMSRLAWSPAAWIARWRSDVGDRIEQVLGRTPASAILRALVIGDDSQITSADWQLFVDTGINHLVSISGLHITMLAALGYGLVGWCWRLKPAWSLFLPSRLAAGAGAALVAIGYSALAGFSIPTQRTLDMLLTVFVMLAFRQRLPFSWVLSVALWVVLLLDPWSVMAPGFWLSFGAVAVLAFAMGGRLRSPAWWQSAIHSQVVMTLALVPVLILFFNQLSLISPWANAIAIPVVSMAVVPLAIAGALLPVDVLLQGAAILWEHIAVVLQWLHDRPWALWYLPTPSLWTWGLAMLGTLNWLMPRGWPMRWPGLLLWAPLFVPSAPLLQPGQMRVTVLDVGQGLSVLVQTAQHRLLYDAGPVYHAQSDAGQRIVLPYLRHVGVKQLDLAVVSHDDNDHVGGMASVLAGVPARRLLSSLSSDATLFTQLQARPHPLDVPHLPCAAGQRWQWDQVMFQVLYPTTTLPPGTRDNDKSCVIQVRSAYGTLLLTGDIEQAAERQLLIDAGATLQSDVMIMPHHGSKTSSSLPFLQQVAPRIAVATVGYRNRFGHPKAEVIARYQQLGNQVLRSDLDGAVIMDFMQGSTPAMTRWRVAEPHYWE